MTQQNPDQEQAARGGIDGVALLRVLVKRRMLIVSTCLATALISAAYSLTLPNVYSATVKVLPPQRESAGMSSMLGQMGGLAGLAGGGKGSESELYLSILKSRSVGEAVMKKLDLARVYQTGTANQTWNKLDAAVKATAGRDGIISITAQHEDPKFSALLANTLADELGRTMVRLNLSKVGSERLFLEKRLEVVKRDLQAAENDLKAFAQSHKIAQVEAQVGVSVTNVGRLKAEVASKEVQLAVLRQGQTDESYDVKALQVAINRLKAELGQSSGKGGGGEGIPSIGNVPGLGLEYSRKLRELKTQEVVYEQLTKQYEMAKLNQAKDASSLQILDEALVPDTKIGPKRASMVFLATVVALVASVVLAFALEYPERMSDEQRQALARLGKDALSLR